MPKIRSKGDTVMFRPPLHLWDMAVAEARAAGTTPQRWIIRHCEAALQRIYDERGFHPDPIEGMSDTSSSAGLMSDFLARIGQSPGSAPDSSAT